ncbi:MAG TPA: tetratricopeptide repeat protein [Rhizomicrobium sp.]|nr:tetratricopeptide repeat protein [Rhizomicrobium sp.]
MHRAFLLLCVASIALGACETIHIGGNQTPSSPQSAQAESFGDYLSARLAASDHNMADAARLYASSLEADPDNVEILSRAFLYAAAAGDVTTAAKLAERVIQKEPDNRAARLALAVAAIGKGDYAAARTDLSQSAKGAFTELTLVLLDAWASAGAGDLKSADADLAQVVPQGGTEALMQFHRALILDLAGDSNSAEKAYVAAVAAGGASPRIAEAFGRFLEREGRKDDARTYYSKLQADAALGPMAAQGLARLAANEKPDRLVASLADGAAEALFGIAAALADQNSADVAVFYLRLALFLEPRMDIAKIVLADRFETLDKYEDAIAAYRALDAKSIYRAAAAVQIALDETRLGKNDEAIGELKAMTEQAPKDITVWTALGDAYRNESKFVEAADAYNRAVAMLTGDSKTSWPLYYARAIAEERSHRWDVAETDLKHALQLSPDQPQVLNYLGYSWVDQGRNLPQALAMLEKARSLSPFDGYIVDSVGWAYYRLGRYDDAVKTLEAAIQLVPGDATVNEHLGDAYWKVGRKLEARFQWSHALAFGQDQTQKAELEKKLQAGDDVK